MAAKDFALQHDRFFDLTARKSQGRRNAVKVFHMKATDNGDGSTKRWTNDGSSDLSGTGINAPTPVGALVDIRVERVVRRSAPSSLTSRIIHSWNGTDTSQLTLVAGNGVGGVGSVGDWSLSASTFPSDDAPALVFTNNNNNTNPAIWLFNDFPGELLPEKFSFAYRNLLQTGGVCDLGIVLYYEDNDHYFAVQRASLNKVNFRRSNGAGGAQLSVVGRMYKLPSGNRDATYGELVGGTVRIKKASSTEKPWMVGKVGGEGMTSWSETGQLEFHRAGGFTQVSANNDWLSLGSYDPRIGIVVFGAGTAGSEYLGGLSFLNAYGGV